MAIQTRLRRWGNSIGIVIPRETMVDKNLKEGEEVIVDIEKSANLSEIFGSLKDWKIDPQKFKDEIRKEETKNDKILFRHLRNN